MIDEGADAPTFELPAVRDGAVEQVALSAYLDDQVVILAFYPGDFNPACDASSTDLDDLDLFTMQKDVSVLAISGDSVYSHRAFAEEYALHIPLLSDAHGEVAEAYGVAIDDDAAGYLTKRAVVVVDHRRTVEYTWEADGVTEAPNVDAIRQAVQNVGDDDSAFARYRVGHAHYMEGRRAFTSAMNGYEQKEWMIAKGDFDSAFEEFSEAEDEFNTAARFAEDDMNQTYYERAERKAESLWRAAEWLSESANAYASGEGGEAQSLRSDAESPLENARAIHDPTPPDEFPPDDDPAEADDDQPVRLGDDSADVSLAMGVEPGEAAVDDNDSAPTATADAGTAGESRATVADDSEFDEASDDDTAPEAGPVGETAGHGESGTDSSSADESADSIDDEELEEIAAELEQQTEAARAQESDDIDDGNVVPGSIDVDDEPDNTSEENTGSTADSEGSGDDDEIELDLADPTDGEDEDETEDEDEDEIDAGELDGGGDHGVPDSL